MTRSRASSLALASSSSSACLAMIACRAATSFGSGSWAKVMHGFSPATVDKYRFILLKTNR